MIISRTPFRISFFGGGTDYPAWYLEHGGSVLAAAIDKYCYLTCRYLPPFFDHRLRVVYSKIETCDQVDQIRHPAVREVIRYLGVDRGLEIHHDGDLPARSGMGSSSSFTVGLLHALYALAGRMPTKRRLAEESIHIEQQMIRETVGSQDQVSAAHGGLNHIMFHRSGRIDVRPVTLSHDRLTELSDHLMLFYTGIMRTAENIAKSYVVDIDQRNRQLEAMGGLVEQGLEQLHNGNDISDFGRLLHETWQMKRQLSAEVSNDRIDEMYRAARAAGALGGKITGAGGGGFLLLFVPPECQPAVADRLNRLIRVPFSFDFSGSQIIFFDPENDYSAAERNRLDQELDAFCEHSELVSPGPKGTS